MENSSKHNFHQTIIIALICLLFFNNPLRAFAKSSINLSPELRQLTDKKVTRDFILYNYAHVVNDLINGEGVYLDNLYDLLGVEDNKKEIFRKFLIKSILEIKRIPDLSNCVAGYSESC